MRLVEKQQNKSKRSVKILIEYLYQKYLSSKIEQLFDVFFGIEEQAESKKNEKIKIFL